jgi:hypothetical protein
MLDRAGITEQRAALCGAARQAFYNTSKFTLRDLRSRASQQQLLADFTDYLDGFSSNVQDILENFKFRNQLPTLSKSDSLLPLIEKFLDPGINLSPDPVLNGDGSVKHPGMDNHSMGTVFEELVRKFNEDNNEEAGEHWTPRDAVRLMANLIFLPIADAIQSGSYLLYDDACGTGGILTVAEETLLQLAAARGQQVTTHLYGQEINPETYAICKADMILKGEGEAADHIVGGAEWSTLAHDAFPAMQFDFMLSNPPYGKSWEKDLEAMGGKDGMRDPRFKVMHHGEELSLVTRSSDGQMLFLANMASKMNHDTPLGSRIAEVHNGSSLFTGDAGQGESNIRRWLIENDWLEAIVALPLNLFYNTGSPPTSGSSPTASPTTARARSSSLTPPNGSSRSARTSARRTANSPPKTSSASATPTSPSRKRRSQRSSPTPLSATGRSPSSARSACTASFRSRPLRGSDSPLATKTSVSRSTMSSATNSWKTSPASPKPWRNASPIGPKRPIRPIRPTRPMIPPRRHCPNAPSAGSWTPPPGNATPASSKPPPPSAKNSAATCSEITISSATAWTPR